MRKIALLVMAAPAVVASVAACSPSKSPTLAPSIAPSVASSPNCPASAAALTPVPPRSTNEPILAVPQPSGWKMASVPSEAAPTTRAALVNARLQSHDFNPTVLITLVDVTTETNTPEQALANEQGGVAQAGVHIDEQIPGTVCGYPSTTLTYSVDGRQETQRIVALKDRLGNIWVTSVQIQTADPVNPVYVKDSNTILDGFQVAMPGRE
jgi:hypothetical protein